MAIKSGKLTEPFISTIYPMDNPYLIALHDALPPSEARLYRSNRAAGKHTYGSCPRGFKPDAWRKLQRALQKRSRGAVREGVTRR